MWLITAKIHVPLLQCQCAVTKYKVIAFVSIMGLLCLSEETDCSIPCHAILQCIRPDK